MKAADLMVGDVVCFANHRFPFGDHQVIGKDDDGVYLRRPYVDSLTGEVEYEDGFWHKDSDFEFVLLERYPLEANHESCRTNR
jgi:hypothetical protein